MGCNDSIGCTAMFSEKFWSAADFDKSLLKSGKIRRQPVKIEKRREIHSAENMPVHHKILWILVPLVLALAGCRAKMPLEDKSVAELESILREDDPVAQAQAAYHLSRRGPEARTAVPALIEALKKETLVRQNAALALGQIGPDAKEAVPALVEALRDPEWTVRRQAAVALGLIGPHARPAIPALQKLKQDRRKYVQDAAQEALRRIRQKEH